MSHSAIDKSYLIFAGKFRRYHGEGWKQILDVPTMLKNLRDSFYSLIGLLQSIWLLGRLRPAAVFVKGGFVGVPVGLASAVWRIPYATHDSDAVPGLANRIIKKWAAAHAVGMPAELYPYPRHKTHYVGVPVQDAFSPVDAAAKRQFRHELHIPEHALVVLVTGGGLGAERLNIGFQKVAPQLLTAYPELFVLHITGRRNEEATDELYAGMPEPLLERIAVRGFVTDLYRFSGAADVVVTRAGASALAEFAVQGKACIVVPNPQLTGGHQLKNAEALASEQAIELVKDSTLRSTNELYNAVSGLLNDKERRDQLEARIRAFSHPLAASQLADIIYSLPNSKNRK